MAPPVLLLATTTGYQIRSFGTAAAGLGVKLVFASDRCDQLDDPWWDSAIPVRFHDEARSVDAVVRAFQGVRPAGILAVGDRPVHLAARLAGVFGLPGNPPDAAAASRNKRACRAAFETAGMLTPVFQDVPLDADVDRLSHAIQYPVVVKPLALSGSRGVMRADNAQQLRTACDRLRAVLDSADVQEERDASHGRALIESFIPGREFAVEGLLTEGDLRVLAIFDKPDPLDGPFFEETIYVTPSRCSGVVQEAIAAAIASGVRALGLRHGAVHAECRVNDTGVYVLEIAARPIGGLCSRALRFERQGRTDVPLEELLLRHAIGEDVSSFVREADASGVTMIPIPRRGILRGVDGVEAARAVAGVDDVQITTKADTLLVPLPEGRSYLGFIFARGAAPDEVERALRGAHARLVFTIDREVPVAHA